ncbi:DNA protecting protein DprA [Micromonospora sp. Llam0]|uniref:DNA-processing protein DprA n=1 Tax=Micromonospora sp. Llam0 TaxID=2485143 RepID=UPI000F4789DB|nr:DNA-processing protein DprA [Micromonospora sp. Llam0]ROO52741.1 DNA protecting protein DprA [Micromonospora sp. Llam0]
MPDNTQLDGETVSQETLPGVEAGSNTELRHPAAKMPFGPSLLALAKVHRLGHKGLADLVDHLGRDIGLLLEDDHARALTMLQAVKIPSAHRVADALAEDRKDLITAGCREFDRLTERAVILLGPGEIPPRLRALPDGPRWLFVQGRAEVLDDGPYVAVVGTREPSLLGVKATEAVARTMAAYPITLVSGLANGIDAAAHRFALRDSVTNVAFLGHGINVIFPSETSEIRQRIIASGGAVVSEYLPDDHYKKHYFVARNRLQAGLSNIVVAADGTASGGTAHTVRFAAKYGRPTVGLQFEGARNLAKLVAEQDAGEVVKIFDDSGRRHLDRLFRALCNQVGKPTNGLKLVEHLLDREVRLRDIPRSDLEQLITRLTRLIEESS